MRRCSLRSSFRRSETPPKTRPGDSLSLDGKRPRPRRRHRTESERLLDSRPTTCRTRPRPRPLQRHTLPLSCCSKQRQQSNNSHQCQSSKETTSSPLAVTSIKATTTSSFSWHSFGKAPLVGSGVCSTPAPPSFAPPTEGRVPGPTRYGGDVDGVFGR